jgi:hypothetical protein
MPLKISDILNPMLAAAQGSFGRDWPAARDFARAELRRLARVLGDIAAMTAAGLVNEQQAKALLNIHKLTTQNVLLTVQGLGIIAVENAINAALAAAKKAVNKAAGLALIP